MLNLDNFEDPEYSASQYILTSPRSLRACAKLNIKPIELLYKPLSDFEGELKFLGATDSSIYASFQKYEEDRKETLKKARKERKCMQNQKKREEQKAKDGDRSVLSSGQKVVVKKQKKVEVQSSWSDLELVGQAIGPKGVNIKKSSSDVSARKRPSTTASKHRPSSMELSSQSQSSLSMTSSTQRIKKPLSKITTADVPARDRKILELMMARREEERALADLRATASFEWDCEKEKAARENELAEQRYRKTVVKKNKERKEKLEGEKARREAEEREMVELQRQLVESEASAWDERAEKIKQDKMYKIQQKKMEDEKKKILQEVRLHHLEEEDSLVRLSFQDQQKESLAQAEEKRREMEREKRLQLQMKNVKERMAHERFKTALEGNKEKELAFVRTSIAKKLTRAEERVLTNQALRDEEIRTNRDRKLQREHERQAVVEKLREDVEDWKFGVSLRQKAGWERAEEVVVKVSGDKARVAHEQRMSKEQEHRRKVERLRKEEEERRRRAEREVQIKDMRSQAVLREKEDQIRKSRDVARASEYLRTKILRNDTRSIDSISRVAKRSESFQDPF